MPENEGPVMVAMSPFEERNDLNLLLSIKDKLLPEMLALWQEAEKKVTAAYDQTPPLSDDRLQRALALAWMDAQEKLDGIKYLVEHLEYRINNIRLKGILRGDPREVQYLKEAAPSKPFGMG